MDRNDLEQWKAKEVARLLALVETERRYYQEMVAILPVALVVLSADRHVSSANRAFRQTFGLRSSDIRGRAIEQILPSERLVEKIRDVHITGAPETVFPLEFDGRRFTAAVVPMRNWDDESEIETLLTFREADGTATAAPRPMAETASEVPAILWEADASTFAFRIVSGDVEPMLGFPPAHWTSSPHFFADRIYSEDRAATMNFYHSRPPGDASAEFRAIHAAGGTVWVRETIRTNGDKLTGVITSIARRKQLEDQLLRSARADALKGISSKLAHDLNNPLMIVTGYAEEMRHSLPEDDPMLGDVDQILSATDRISSIATQLLNYTRRQAQPASPVNVTRLLTGLEEKIAHAAGAGAKGEGLGGESVAVHLVAGEPVWALADEAQLEEIVMALISADREDARERSRIAIGCEVDIVPEQVCGTSLPQGTYTRILIHDDGRGFDAAKRDAVFENLLWKPGEKSAASALAHAYAVVREWGGDIAFFSEPSRGSTFLVYLPHYAQEPKAAEDAPDPPSNAEAPQEPAPEPAPEIVRETILLVEDEAGIRALVRKILRRENYNVLEAGSAEEAIAMAGAIQSRIDLLVTDVILPMASGRDLAEHVRQARPDLKILYISGYTDDDAVRTGAIPPGSKFLQKPFTLGSLVGKVKEALAG